MRKHKIIHKGRRTATFEERSLPIDERSLSSIPTEEPHGQEVKINQVAKESAEEMTQITEMVKIQCPQQMRYLIQNLEMDDEETFLTAINTGDQIKIVSNGGLKRFGGFGWVAAIDEENIASFHGRVTGSEDQMSSFRSETTGMAAAMYLFSKVAKAMESKPEVSLWTDNTGLVKRVEKLVESDPIEAHLMPDHDMYAVIRDSLANLEVTEVGHVKGHQDRESRTLTNTEKMNVEADRFATLAVKDAKICEPE